MKTPKILTVITTFNPNDRFYPVSFNHFTHEWFKCINSWLDQEEVEGDLVVADTISGLKTRERLLAFQKGNPYFHLDFINHHYSMLIAINHAIGLMEKEKYDYFAFSHSDLEWRDKHDLAKMLSIFEDYPNTVLIAPQSDKDMCIFSKRLSIFDENKSPTRVVLGEGVNGHLYIWNKRFAKAYDYRIPDILEGSATESFFHYLVSALKADWRIAHNVMITHRVNLDKSGDFRYTVNPLYHRDFQQMLNEGRSLGMGHEEMAPPSVEKYRVDHDKSVYDENGYPLRAEEFYQWLKENIFLRKEDLDYDQIPCEKHLLTYRGAD